MVVSNHRDAEPMASDYEIPFHFGPLDSLNKAQREDSEMELLDSFLPAFTGAKPYHAAFERGVKLIGGTSHYVTENLDDGPTIEQDVTPVSHRDQVAELLQKGSDRERVVPSRAVRWHRSHRMLFYGDKTVVFD